MNDPRRFPTRFRALLLPLLLAACVSSAPPTRPNDREWNAIVADHEAVDAIRRQAPDWRQKKSRREQIEIVLETYRKLDPLFGPFMEKVKEYHERTDDPRAAHLYAMEKMRMGDEYMNVLARYDNALTVYQEAQTFDPSNTEVSGRIAEAQSHRFVAMDRFAQVRDGMSEEQVRQILGQPREDWIKQVVQKNRVYAVWIYPKQDGGASAVYFNAGVVYHSNWNAAPSKGEGK